MIGSSVAGQILEEATWESWWLRGTGPDHLSFQAAQPSLPAPGGFTITIHPKESGRSSFTLKRDESLADSVAPGRIAKWNAEQEQLLTWWAKAGNGWF